MDPDSMLHSALEVAGAYFRAGADKVSIGSEAVYAVERMLANDGCSDGKSAVETITRVYGRQAIVVSIDPRHVYVQPSYGGLFKNELRGEPFSLSLATSSWKGSAEHGSEADHAGVEVMEDSL